MAGFRAASGNKRGLSASAGSSATANSALGSARGPSRERQMMFSPRERAATASNPAVSSPRGTRRIGPPAPATQGRSARGWMGSNMDKAAEDTPRSTSAAPTVFVQSSRAASEIDARTNTMASLEHSGQVQGLPWREDKRLVVPNPRSRSVSPGSDAFPLQTPEDSKSGSAAQWWLSEAKRMREEALKMRKERDRFRVAVEDAHFECRRLSTQVHEFQAQLRHTQQALRESKGMADAARKELERLRHWIEEAHAESRRLTTEVQEYEWQLQETRLTLDEAERSCQELKAESENRQTEIIKLSSRLRELDRSPRKSNAEKEVADAQTEGLREELSRSRLDIKELQQSLEDERHVSETLSKKLQELLARVSDEDQAALQESLSESQVMRTTSGSSLAPPSGSTQMGVVTC